MVLTTSSIGLMQFMASHDLVCCNGKLSNFPLVLAGVIASLLSFVIGDGAGVNIELTVTSLPDILDDIAIGFNISSKVFLKFEPTKQ